MNSSTNMIFILLAFLLGAVLIWTKDTLPEQLRRPMAITALCLIVFAFYVVVSSFFMLGASFLQT